MRPVGAGRDRVVDGAVATVETGKPLPMPCVRIEGACVLMYAGGEPRMPEATGIAWLGRDIACRRGVARRRKIASLGVAPLGGRDIPVLAGLRWAL